MRVPLFASTASIIKVTLCAGIQIFYRISSQCSKFSTNGVKVGPVTLISLAEPGIVSRSTDAF